MSEDRIEWGEVTYPPGARIEERRQTAVQVVSVLTGSVTVWVDGSARTAGANCAFVLLPGHAERFAFSTAEPTRHGWIHFWFAEPDAELLARLAAAPGPVVLSPAVAADLRELADLEVSRLPTRRALQHLVARQALLRLLGEAELAAGGAGARSEPVQRALAAIEDRFDEPLDVAALAAAAHVSRAHLMRLFARELGTTPTAELWRRRTERGLRLLEGTGLPVAEVAARCGFASAQHFARRVRAATGTTPAAWRARSWGG